MNILVVPSWYPPFDNLKSEGGSFFREQAIALAKNPSNKVYILDLKFVMKGKPTPQLLAGFFYTDGDLYVYTKYCIGLSKSFNFQKTLAYKKELKRIICTVSSIDIIWAHSVFPAGLSMSVLGRKYHIPVVITEHASWISEKKLNFIDKQILKHTLTRSNVFVCVSNKLRINIQEMCHNKKKILVIPNFISSEFSPPDSQQYQNCLSQYGYKILSVGALIDRKKHDLLIRAFYSAFNEIPNTYLYIIGSGEEENSLKALIQQLKLQKRVFIVGKIPRDEIGMYFKSCDLFALASETETFGVVYIEALACGKPVVSVQNGGADDIIRPCCGILVQRNNEQAFSHALINARSMAFSEHKIKQYFVDNFSDSAIIKQYSSIFDTLVKP